jgi:peroxiredoxin
MFNTAFTVRRWFKIAAMTVLLTAVSLVFVKPGAAEVKMDDKSRQVLEAMGGYYQSLESMSVTASMRMSRTVQGQKQEAAAKVDYAMQRPGKLAISPGADAGPEATRGIGMVRSDGKEVTIYVAQLRRYTTEPMPKSLDDLFNNRVLDIVSRSSASLVTALMSSDPVWRLLMEVEEVRYLGLEEAGGVATHRVRLSRADTMAMDVWIAAGDKPLLMKAVPDLSLEEQRAKQAGQEVELEMSLELVNQQANPKLEDAVFAFEPPAGAEKVASLMDSGQEDEAHPLQGQAAPDFELTDLEGKAVKLADHAGKEVVILDFWATWCGPCIKAMPIIDGVAHAFKDKGVVLYAVNLREGPDKIKAFLEQRKLSTHVLLDPKGEVGDKYQVEGIPQTVVIGKDGKVAKVFVGLLPDLKQRLTAELEAATK